MAAACTGAPLATDQADALRGHLQECARCATELSAFEGMERGIVAAFETLDSSGDVGAALRGVDRARTQRSFRGWAFPDWLIPVTASAAVAVGVVMAMQPDAPRGASPNVPAIAESAGDGPRDGLSVEEQRDVDQALAVIAEGQESEASAWESFSDETYWDVADDLEMHDLEGFEESLDALLEG